MSSSEIINRPPSSGSSIIAPQEPETAGGVVHISGGGLAGDGTVGDPLHTVAGGTAVATDGTSITGNGTTGEPLTATGGGGAGASQLPLTWRAQSIAASADTDIVSSIASNLSTWTAPRAGSIVGISLFLTAPITAGSLTLTAEIADGTVVAACTVTPASDDPQLAFFAQDAGIDTYNPGDQIGMRLTTSGAFAPADTLTVYGWIEVSEAV